MFCLKKVGGGGGGGRAATAGLGKYDTGGYSWIGIKWGKIMKDDANIIHHIFLGIIQSERSCVTCKIYIVFG